MKLPLLLPFLSAAVFSAVAAEVTPTFIVCSTTIIPTVPTWALDNESDGFEEADGLGPSLSMDLCARYPLRQKQTPSDDAYAVGEKDQWTDWDDDEDEDDEEEENEPFLTNVRFQGTLSDATGSILYTATQETNISLHADNEVLRWNLSTNTLPDTINLQLKGTLSFTAWQPGTSTPSEPFSLKTTAQNYSWAEVNGYRVILEEKIEYTPDDDDDEDFFDDEDEEEAPLDDVDDDDVHEPIPQQQKQQQYTARLTIESPQDRLKCVTGISVRLPDGKEHFISADSMESDDDLHICKSFLTPQLTYRLHLLTEGKEHRIELNQSLNLNGK